MSGKRVNKKEISIEHLRNKIAYHVLKALKFPVQANPHEEARIKRKGSFTIDSGPYLFN